MQTLGAGYTNALGAGRLAQLKRGKAALQRPPATAPRTPSMPPGSPRRPAVEAPDTADESFEGIKMMHRTHPARRAASGRPGAPPRHRAVC